MNKFANFIIKGRYWFLGIFFVLLVVSAIVSNYVTVNYDLTNYLPDSSTTRQSLEKMKDEFGATGTASVMLQNVDSDTANTINATISSIDGVATSIITKTQDKDDIHYTLINIFLTDSDYTQKAEVVLTQLETTLNETLNDTQHYYLIGSAVSACASRDSLSNEVKIILIMAVVIVLLVLLLTTRSWIEPIILLMVIGTAIVINMGTNYLLGSISFISNSIASILLIALAMDYSIVLINRFREERDKTEDIYEAMKNALTGSMTTIISSGLTVMAGLLSLIFMSYKIGLDMGLVLTKGVLISILAVIFLMPAILLLFAKLLKKTEHKSFLPNLKRIGNFAKATRFILPIIFVVLICGSFVIQNQMLNFDFTSNSTNESSQVYKDNASVENVFGVQNTLVLLVDKNMSNDEQINLFNYITTELTDNDELINTKRSFLTSGDSIQLGTKLGVADLQVAFGLNNIQAAMILSNLPLDENDKAYAYEILEFLGTDTTVRTYMTTEQIAQVDSLYQSEQLAKSLFIADNYTRFILNINATTASDDAINYVNSLNTYLENNTYLKDNNFNYYIVSNTQNAIETQELFKTDRIIVELVSVIAILLIVLFAFKSVSIPVILVIGIQGAIWINLAGNAILGNSLFFLCYLIGTAIQMGATIDYGILLTDRYVVARKTQNKYEAIKTAIDKSFVTIITSGSILTLAAFAIGIFSTTPMISSIGYLVGFGALCASLTMLFVVPQALLISDKVIEKTTRKANFYHEEKVVETTCQKVKDEK